MSAAMLPLIDPPPVGAGTLTSLLERAPELIQAVLDAIPARVIVLDEQERLQYANHEFFVFTRLHARQVLGRGIAEIIGDETHAGYATARERLWRGETVSWQGWTSLKGVGRRYMREHLVPVGAGSGAGGAPRATVIMSLDWTELKRREEELSQKVDELAATQALKGAIVDNALAALVSTDAAGRIVEFNPAAEAMFGRRRTDVIGLPVAEVIIPHRHRAAHEAGMGRLAAGAPARVLGKRLEMAALRADGSEFPVEMVLWRTRVGATGYYTASLVDQTDRQAAAQEIERQREALRQSEKLTAMGSLLAGVAHELNNPLAIVLGRAALLEEKAAALDGLADDARRIREAANRCARIVRTFLNMAQAKPGERTPVQLNDLVRAATDILAYNLRTHGVRLTLELDPQLPLTQADGDQVGQIVLNLLVNAEQALAQVPPAQREVVVRTGVEAPRQGADAREVRVWLRVVDHGPGVPAAIREKLFEPYFTTKPSGQGTGLGLAVSRGIAREHGGDLVLETTSVGASFRLSLPLRGEPAPVPPALPEPVAGAAARARVLVIDDEPEIGDLMRELLEAAGHEVASAESGAVALALLEEARFDAVVSDLHMPDMDGATLWREIRQRVPALATRTLFVTGDTLSPAVRQFLDQAQCPSLSKPFTRDDLVAGVGRLLGSP